MSHDRGCPCGLEKWDFRQCYARKGQNCYRAQIVEAWVEKEKPTFTPATGLDTRQPEMVSKDAVVDLAQRLGNSVFLDRHTLADFVNKVREL